MLFMPATLFNHQLALVRPGTSGGPADVRACSGAGGNYPVWHLCVEFTRLAAVNPV